MSSESPVGVLTTTPAVLAPVRAASHGAPQPAVDRDVLARAAQRVARLLQQDDHQKVLDVRV